jgi:cysteine desulfuration protein SufE
MNRSIEEIEKDIIDEFSIFTDWLDKYQYIIDMGQELGEFPENKKTEEFRIKGCQSSVWLTAELADGKIIFKSDSDSSIVKGLASLMIRVLSNQKPDDIVNAKLEFIDKIGLKDHLAPTRSNGLSAMIKQMRMYALAYKLKQQEQKVIKN